MNYLALGIALAIVVVLYLIIEVIVRMSGKRSKSSAKIAEEAARMAGHSYEWSIQKGILYGNTHGITEVRGVEMLKTINFHREQYPEITAMVREAKDADTIRNFSIDDPHCSEDITIVTFADQDGRRWVAIMYDSDELWQDPEAIDLLPAGF